MKKLFMLGLFSVSLMATDISKEVETLSPEVRGLLSQEMLHIEKGMHQIFSNIVKGNYEEVSKIAKDIEASFIFKKELTKSQRSELKAKISKEFIAMDSGFHEKAGKLAIAAEFDEKENIQKYFSSMTDSCVQCHSKFATHRFTTFKD